MQSIKHAERRLQNHRSATPEGTADMERESLNKWHLNVLKLLYDMLQATCNGGVCSLSN